MNKILLVGRTTKDLELKVSANGQAYTVVTLAVDDRGNEKQPVDFFDIKVFGKSAEVLAKFCSQGQTLGIEAKAKQNVYEKDGQKIYKIDFILNEFEFLGSAPKKEEQKEEAQEVQKEEAPKEEKGNLPW